MWLAFMVQRVSYVDNIAIYICTLDYYNGSSCNCSPYKIIHNTTHFPHISPVSIPEPFVFVIVFVFVVCAYRVVVAGSVAVGDADTGPSVHRSPRYNIDPEKYAGLYRSRIH